MPMRVIAKKRCRAMFEPPEKGERAHSKSSPLDEAKPTFFRSGPWAAGWLLLVEEGERAALNFQRKDFEIVQQDQIRDASHLYEVERRVQHAARPGFRIMELQLSPTQKVPWHSHTNITDTFYVLEGHMRLFLQNPKEEVNLKPGEIHVVGATRPHLVTNGGTKSLTFLVLQGIGEYDYVPLTSS